MWPPIVKPAAPRIVYFTNPANDKKSLPPEVCVLEPGVSMPVHIWVRSSATRDRVLLSF